MFDYFDYYDKKYPDIVIEILEYFEISNNVPDNLKEKSVLKFCILHKNEKGLVYQPGIVNRICKKLCNCGRMECIKQSNGLGLDNNYVFILKDKELLKRERQRLKVLYNSIVYGFDYIYDLYKDLVIPLVWEKPDGGYSAGTGFKYSNGIVTAKHCICDVTNLQIKGYRAEELSNCHIYISDDNNVDLAFIETGRVDHTPINIDEGEVMQEVLVMGYPKIPAFTDFLTIEKATISSKASSRITPTRGAIAAYGYEYLTKMDAMLITAKIRGGNSGGPVINENGCLVGISCQILDSNPQNGDYDDLGYGVAIPVKYLQDLVDRKPVKLELKNDFFRDFIE